MDEEKTEEFIRTSIGRDIFGSRKLLVWDSYRAHFTPNIKALCANFNIDMVIISGIIIFNVNNFMYKCINY